MRHRLPKPGVAGSSPVSRFRSVPRSSDTCGPAEPSRFGSARGPDLAYLMTVAALRSLIADRHAELPLRRRRFTLSLLVVLTGELIGFVAIGYIISRLV